MTSAPVEESLDALLERAASGDKLAFRALYDRTSARLFAICLRIARNRTLAEDFLQEAFARVWERAPQFDRQRGSALAWMIALTRHHAIDVIRTRGREVLSADGAEFELPDQSTLAPAEARLDLPAIARALAELDDGLRRAILHASGRHELSGDRGRARHTDRDGEDLGEPRHRQAAAQPRW